MTWCVWVSAMASQNPQLVRLLRHETPHFVRFDVKALEKHMGWETGKGVEHSDAQVRGQKRAPIKSINHRMLTPIARHMPCKEIFSPNRSAPLRHVDPQQSGGSQACSTNCRPQVVHRWFCLPL